MVIFFCCGTKIMVWLILLGNTYRNRIEWCLLPGVLVPVGWQGGCDVLGLTCYITVTLLCSVWVEPCPGQVGRAARSCLASSCPAASCPCAEEPPAKLRYRRRHGCCSFVSFLACPFVSGQSVVELHVPAVTLVLLCPRLCRGWRDRELFLQKSFLWYSLRGKGIFCISLAIAAAENCWPLH